MIKEHFYKLTIKWTGITGNGTIDYRSYERSHKISAEDKVVLDYIDNPTGIMMEAENGSGKFKEVTLCPTVTMKDHNSLDKPNELHEKANRLCFIANSVNFTIKSCAEGKIKLIVI